MLPNTNTWTMAQPAIVPLQKFANPSPTVFANPSKVLFEKRAPRYAGGARYRGRLLALIVRYQEATAEILFPMMTELRPRWARTVRNQNRLGHEPLPIKAVTATPP